MIQNSIKSQIRYFFTANFQLPLVFVSHHRGKMTTVGGLNSIWWRTAKGQGPSEIIY